MCISKIVLTFLVINWAKIKIRRILINQKVFNSLTITIIIKIICFYVKIQNIYCDVFISGKIFGKGQQEKIERFVKFVVFCYIPWWLTAQVSSSAPKNDLLFLNSLFDYKTIDSVIANEALRRFGNHMWYLTEELVPLCFFSNNVKDSTKLAMAKKLLNFEKNECFYNRFGSGFGKPKFPKLNDDFSKELDFYVGNDSWMFF